MKAHPVFPELVEIPPLVPITRTVQKFSDPELLQMMEHSCEDISKAPHQKFVPQGE